VWSRLSKRVLKEEPFCRCGCGKRSKVADHIIGRRFGGQDIRSNLQGLARACHGAKTEQELQAWKQGKRSARVENGQVVYS
jgi:5-methylcytosine-specific restriction endonuclease McrA